MTHWEYCPDCGGNLDTGYECNSCKRDWLPVVQAAQPVWTGDLPKAEGEYWFRSPACKPVTVSVWMDAGEDLRAQIGCKELHLCDLDAFEEFEDGEWAGPLSPPREA